MPQNEDSRAQQGVGTPAVQVSAQEDLRQNPYLRIFKSNVFVRDHDRALKF